MPTSFKPQTSAIHRVLIESGADPRLVHPAIEEIRRLSGQNVITAVGSQITDFRSETKAQITDLRSETKAQITDLRSELQAQINDLRSETKAQIHGLRSEIQAQIADLRSEVQTQINDLRSEVQAQINDLRSEMQAQIHGLQVQITGLRAEMNTLNKVVWPLISLLFIPMLGLLYKILTE